ncbi:hypothetical protein DOTSEDRAFT_73537 [Dothistroma septosporum NZE10]|uniref:Uncharacterized protein n=1 Tax=Dothistroma septosporum (strain NZE10 / CBS 128990) TaxID=675120 RepID=N1PG92_DOTSN|nr:hypothetical protein DOTSEDRAFT_73537 [Dothistroma septosporum NZE10]
MLLLILALPACILSVCIELAHSWQIEIKLGRKSTAGKWKSIATTRQSSRTERTH